MNTMTAPTDMAGMRSVEPASIRPSASTSTPPQPEPRERRQVPNVVYSIVSVALLIVIWTALSHSSFIKPGYLPTPESLWGTLMELIRDGYQGQPLLEHIKVSLLRTLAGFAAGVLVGVPLGLFTGYNSRAGAMISPIMAFIRPIPPIAFIPMAVLYFGLGELGKIVLIFFVSFNYVQANAHAGAANFPIAYRRASESLGLTRWQTFARIVLPGALPQIFTGLKVALALSWAVVVAAELVGAQSGLGFMISDAALLFRIPVVFIGIALIGAIGLAMNLALNWLEARIVHWKGR
ncbi:ABC transporter permease [Variovorax sp. Sphag1AA]|uniref:ABC transporter permease n=1 Tax=Variovorax sp. Sphag1AA TaxID=2587027 RepID=UPI00183B8E16|nr:ABC transporter permease [Variovorax sp. Sphag1AA]MBB3178399.1 NitT/TauT family transport system permease protein [Variovorax sp. Sphag1AA]